MCRIAGIVCPESDNARSAGLELMLSSMARGGPDDEGVFHDRNLCLGHRRLAIIDLSVSGHQPMADHTNEVIISFNGEIYNYRELRSELVMSGVKFRTSSDTEVIVQAYLHWGTRAFVRLRGMFAFALYHTTESTLYLVRDGIGIKPLYYSAGADRIVFSSEVRAFQAMGAWKRDPNWQTFLLAFGYIPHPFTTLQGVRSLTPGSFLKIDVRSRTIHAESFTMSSTDVSSESLEQSIERIRVGVNVAVDRHLIADAPLGVFLSGGIDSSLLTLLAAKKHAHLKTVSVNFKEATFDERSYQEMVLKKSGHGNHDAYTIDEQMLWQSLTDIWAAMDQPTLDGVNSYFVSRCANQSGLKAVLSGLGADELFGGYDSASRISLINKARLIPFKKIVGTVASAKKDAYQRLSYLNIKGPVGDYLFLRGIHTPDFIGKVLGEPEDAVIRTLQSVDVPGAAVHGQQAYASLLESHFYMRNQLLKDTDFMSMHFGLEVRVPFLDQDLVEIVKSISDNNKFRTGHAKFLLTSAFADVLPTEIVQRKKQGFVFPFPLWLSRKLDAADSPVNAEIKKHMAPDWHWSKTWSLVVCDHFERLK